jgi:hypothetical protein
MRFPGLFKKEIVDAFAQENFRRILDYFAVDPVSRSSFEFVETTISGAVTNSPVLHHLGFAPKDVILMHNLNNATVTFSYSLFNSTHIYVTSTAATTLRMLIGRYL